MSREIALFSLLVFVLTTPALAQETLSAKVEPNFTVWDLWSRSDYRQLYDWVEFTNELSRLNHLEKFQLDHLQAGIFLVLPKIENLKPSDFTNFRLSPPPSEKKEKDSSSSISFAEFEMFKTDLGQSLDEFSSKLGTLEGRLGEIERKIPTEFKPAEIEKATNERFSGLENRLGKTESQLLDVKIEMVDWPLSRSKTVEAENLRQEGSLKTFEITKVFGYQVAPFLVLFLVISLVAALTGGYFYLGRQKRQLEFEHQQEMEEAIADTTLEVRKMRGNLLAKAYGWQTHDFRIPHDLLTKESPEVVILVKIKKKGDDQTRPQVLAPCFPENKTGPIFVDNLPNHIRHCDVCREKLSLKRDGAPQRKEGDQVAVG